MELRERLVKYGKGATLTQEDFDVIIAALEPLKQIEVLKAEMILKEGEYSDRVAEAQEMDKQIEALTAENARLVREHNEYVEANIPYADEVDLIAELRKGREHITKLETALREMLEVNAASFGEACDSCVHSSCEAIRDARALLTPSKDVTE